MNFFFKFLQKLSRLFLNLIPIYYKKNHKFLNKNQVTNASIILSLLKDKINPKYILDIGKCLNGKVIIINLLNLEFRICNLVK